LHIAIRVDAGFHIGTGHVMRCLTLATALQECGDSVVFITRDHLGHCYEKIEKAGFPVESLPSGQATKPQQDTGIGHAAWLGVTADQDATDTRDILNELAADWLIVDHYSIDRHWHTQLRGSTKRIMVIDDLADREYDCDLLVDPTLNRQPSDYASLVPANATVLTGSEYAPLHAAFPARRAQALQDRVNRRGRLDRIFISFGSLDPANHTKPVLEKVRELLPGVHIDVVLGREAPHRETVQHMTHNEPRITLHSDVTSAFMAKLMAEADLGIGAAGSTSWERCCLGLPTLVRVIAENQRLIAERLIPARAALQFADTAELEQQLQHFQDKPEYLAAMSENAARITDGHGVQRITGALQSP